MVFRWYLLKTIFKIITKFQVSSIIIMNLEEKKNLVIQLQKKGKHKERLPKVRICLLEILAKLLEK